MRCDFSVGRQYRQYKTAVKIKIEFYGSNVHPLYRGLYILP